MHGTRDAAQHLHDECSNQFKRIGFQQGKASLRIFHHPGGSIKIYVRGDDYVSPGRPGQAKWMKTQVENKYAVKTQVLGPGEGDQLQIKFFNRIVTWDGAKGLCYETGP